MIFLRRIIISKLISLKLMSQDISLIISKEIDLKIASEIPHFINSGVLYIPISILEGCEYGELIKESLNTNDFQILNYIDDYHFLKVVKNIGVKNFIALHFSDYGTMPMYHYEFTVLENLIIKDSIWSSDGLITSENIDSFEENYEKNKGEILLNMKMDLDFIEHLKDYSSCKSLHEKWGNKVNFYEIQNYYIQKQIINRTDSNFDMRGNKTFTGEIFKDENIDRSNSVEKEIDKSKTIWQIIKQTLKI